MRSNKSMIDYQTILIEMREHRKEQHEKVLVYEEKESWAMAYLCNWVVLEKSVKKLYGAYVKSQLLPQILSWKDYLEGGSNKAPEQITNFAVEPIYIPRINILEKIIGRTKILNEVLNSKGKWRVKRNAIAHRTEEFARKNTYIQYKTMLNNALDELENKLKAKSR